MALTPLEFTLATFGVSIVAGVVGALLGLGGGIIVVPTLTLALGIDVRYAIGASLVSIIATSSGAAAAYVRERMTNLRVAMLLELGTSTGAITGAYLAGILSGRWLQVTFGVVMALTALQMLRPRRSALHVPPDPLADRLRLHGGYYDQAEQREIRYRVTRTPLGLALMLVAGVLSGLLGIGSGILKVPAMDLAMGLPIKASTATSNFMIGVTAAAGASVWFARGDIDPFIAGPVAAGVLLGAVAGARVLGRARSRTIRLAFVVVLLITSAQMLWRGLQ